MITAISEGIKIEIKTDFREDLSNFNDNLYFFSYTIFIENQNSFDVQLLSRYWKIFDSLDDDRFVEGPGVVGDQPIIKSNESYNYQSGCDLKSEYGYMKGYYVFKNLLTEKYFKVMIPKFELYYPNVLN